MLNRVLEPEWTDDSADSWLYDQMDHLGVNTRFVEDLVTAGAVGPDVLDLGTGTARIPILLCQRLPTVRVMAVDAAISMLELARTNIDIAGLLDRIQLEHADAKIMEVFTDPLFDTVVSNSLLHHVPDPLVVLRQSIRLLKPGGRIFYRDLLRPDSSQAVEDLVQQHARDQALQAQQLLRQSLHAALTLAEAKRLAQQAGLPHDSVSVTSDRHWTLDTVIGSSPTTGVASHGQGNIP